MKQAELVKGMIISFKHPDGSSHMAKIHEDGISDFEYGFDCEKNEPYISGDIMDDGFYDHRIATREECVKFNAEWAKVLFNNIMDIYEGKSLEVPGGHVFKNNKNLEEFEDSVEDLKEYTDDLISILEDAKWSITMRENRNFEERFAKKPEEEL